MNPIDLLFGFEGRVGRAQFWLALLIWFIVFVVVTLLGLLVSTSLDAWINVNLIFVVVFVILLVPVGIKRLHDRNRRGWWILLLLGGPTVAFLLGQMFAADELDGDEIPTAIMVVQYAGLAILLWALLELGFIRGTIGANPHGPDPVAPKPAKH
jgi:uncharacterized membrane protein YhaH (DUF805 family)